MIMEPSRTSGEALSFGPFRLVVGERLLLKGDKPVELGSRTLDTLIALASRPNEVVSKREMIAQVWPDVVVEEGSLRFHIAALRKALGDGRDGARYITTLAGRGYCFVAPVSVTPVSAAPDTTGQSAVSTVSLQGLGLPARLGRTVGRTDLVAALLPQLMTSRFVTIVGSGGVGKTTLAVAIAHELLEAFAGDVVFVDLGAVSDPWLTATALASILGLSVQSDDPTPSLVAFLRDKRFLLVLDNCEHVIEAAANLAARIFLAAPQVHILATSREALRVEGEQVHRLVPLTVPPDEPGLTAATALTFSAVQLFVERAAATGARLDLTDAEAAIVASICRKVDGLALAIELAAGRVGTYGLSQTLALLDQRLTMLWLGQRTAPPRQKTLRAMLDWSYELLSDTERLVLRRLAVFVGTFTIEAALAVVASATENEVLVLGAIESLVAKSMVATSPVGTTMRYRLLETTRTYLIEISVDDAESAAVAARHATYYQQWLQQTGAEWPTLADAPERASHLANLGNVRAALEWCFSAKGDAGIGVGLASAAVPLFLALSLLTECYRWSERALLALKDAEREEMHLQAALGMSLMFTRGNSERARIALTRSLSIAKNRDDVLGELRALGLLHMFHRRVAEFGTALRYAERSSALAGTTENASIIALGRSLLGVSLYHEGELERARVELEAALKQPPDAQWTSMFQLGFDHSTLASTMLARALWLQGYPDRAIELARRTVRDAGLLDHPVTLSIALTWAISVFLWTGDAQSAEELLDRSISHAEYHALTPNLIQGRGFRGEIALQRGDVQAGVEYLQECLTELHATRYELLTTGFRISLAEGLAALGRFEESLAQIDETTKLVEAAGELVYMPELLRVRGKILLSRAATDGAEACFLQALESGRRMGARSWELRAATDLAALRNSQGRTDVAREHLHPVFTMFTEGLATADLVAAKRMLSALG